MLFGNRGARSSGTKQRKSEAFQPRGEALEQKVLLTLLKLGAGTPTNIASSNDHCPGWTSDPVGSFRSSPIRLDSIRSRAP